jgi:type III secretory pathway component EscT
MQAIIIGFLFGTACAMVLWAAGAAAVTRDQLLRDYGFLSSGEN